MHLSMQDNPYLEGDTHITIFSFKAYILDDSISQAYLWAIDFLSFHISRHVNSPKYICIFLLIHIYFLVSWYLYRINDPFVNYNNKTSTNVVTTTHYPIKIYRSSVDCLDSHNSMFSKRYLKNFLRDFLIP